MQAVAPSVSKTLNARFGLSILRDKERNVRYPPPMFHTSASGSTIIGRAAQFLDVLFVMGKGSCKFISICVTWSACELQ